MVLETAVATGGAGLSLTLSAFLSGMIISEIPYRHVIQTEAKPFRNLLLGFFFITVGMSLDWRILVGHWAEILVFLFALIVIKAALVSAAARVFGWSTPGSVQLGFLLAQGIEWVFVIIAMPTVREALGEGTVVDALKANNVSYEAIEMDYDHFLAASADGYVDEANIQAWMRRHQERALQASIDLVDSRAAPEAGYSLP